MGQQDGTGQTPEGTQSDLPAILSRLKATGAALLVVGDLPEGIRSEACQQMMGVQSEQCRRRLFVSTTAKTPHAVTHFQSPARASDRMQVIQYATEHRSTAVDQSVRDETISTTVPKGSIIDLGIAISEAIDTFDTAANGLAPAELRLCFDSLIPLLSNDEELLFKFLHILIGRLKSVNGMGHFHLPQAYTNKTILRLQSLFDAVVELRLENRQLQQKWYLHGKDVTTDWLVVP